MNINSKIKISISVLFTVLSCFSVENILTHPTKQFSNYTFIKSSEILKKVQPIPPFLLSTMREWDGDSNYSPYFPTKSELKIIKKSYEKTSSIQKEIFKNHLLGLYFISNLQGSGYTDWVPGKNGELYCFIVMSSSVFSKNLDQILTYRENSAFRDKVGTNSFTINISCSDRLNGFMYVLLHEGAHVCDYVLKLTPFVEPALSELYGLSFVNSGYVKNIWKTYKEPVSSYDFHNRENLTFYGFGGGPKLENAAAGEIFSNLSNTPFISLYSVHNWAEDFAEFSTFYQLTKKFGLKYEIIVESGDGKVRRYRPLDNQLAKSRIRQYESFYRSNAKMNLPHRYQLK